MQVSMMSSRSMQWVSSNWEYGAERDPLAWGRPPFIMANPLKECDKRGKEGVKEVLEKIGKET